MNIIFIFRLLGMLLLITACVPKITWQGTQKNIIKFNKFQKENLDFSKCLSFGLPNRNYECLPTTTNPNLNITWSLDDSNTCNFLTIEKTSGKIYGSSNLTQSFSCQMAIKITTPEVSGVYKQTINFLNGSHYFGSGYKIVAAQGDYSYWGLPGAIHTYDISNRALPQKINETNSISDINEMKLYNNYLFVAGSRAGLYVHSLENPEAPKLVSVLPEASSIHDISFVGNRAYLAADVNGIFVLDITNPKDLKIIKKIPISGKVRGIDVHGNYAYIAIEKSGFAILDISSLESAALVSSLAFTSDSVKVKIKNNHAYMANYSNGIQIIDITNPLAPSLTRTLSGIGNPYNVSINGNFLYTVGAANSNRIFNLTDPALPVQESVLYSTTTISIDIKDNYLFLPSEASGGFIYDLSDTSTFVSSLATAHSSREIAIKDNLLVSLAPSTIKVMDITSRESPSIIYESTIVGSPTDIKIAGNYIYYTNSSSLIILDLTNPSAITTVSTTAAVSSASVFIKDNLAFVASGTNGVRIFNITNKISPVLLSTISGVASAKNVFVKDNLAFICSSATTTPVKSAALFIYDITDPSTPTLIAELPTNQSCLNVKVKDDKAFISLNTLGIQIVDVSTPALPTVISALEGFVAEHIDFYGNYAIVSSTWSGVRFVNIQNPLAPILEKTIYSTDTVYMTEVSDNYLFVANYRGGLQFIKLDFLP